MSVEPQLCEDPEPDDDGPHLPMPGPNPGPYPGGPGNPPGPPPPSPQCV